jgi:hypothetical protein
MMGINDIRHRKFSEWNYISIPPICPYGMHREDFTITKCRETTDCSKHMLFVYFVCTLHVNLYLKSKKKIMDVFVFCHLRTGCSVSRRKALHNCTVGN